MLYEDPERKQGRGYNVNRVCSEYVPVRHVRSRPFLIGSIGKFLTAAPLWNCVCRLGHGMQLET